MAEGPKLEHVSVACDAVLPQASAVCRWPRFKPQASIR